MNGFDLNSPCGFGGVQAQALNGAFFRQRHIVIVPLVVTDQMEMLALRLLEVWRSGSRPEDLTVSANAAFQAQSHRKRTNNLDGRADEVRIIARALDVEDALRGLY